MRLCFAEGFGVFSEGPDVFLSTTVRLMGETVLAISCYREENFVWMNVWGLNPEVLCLEWLMVEAIAEGVIFVECLCDWGRRTGKKATLEMVRAEG
jgi:hypothetical protein